MFLVGFGLAVAWTTKTTNAPKDEKESVIPAIDAFMLDFDFIFLEYLFSSLRELPEVKPFIPLPNNTMCIILGYELHYVASPYLTESRTRKVNI